VNIRQGTVKIIVGWVNDPTSGAQRPLTPYLKLALN